MNFSKINYQSLPMLIILILIFTKDVISCSCQSVPPCVNYTEAEKIFIGKLQKVVREKNSSIINANFLIEKVYKGDITKIELIKIETGSCERSFIVGEKYFVYVYRDRLSSRQFCDRTNLLSKATADLEYVNSLSEKYPTFSVNGEVYGLKENELNSIKIQIKSNDKKYALSPDKFGHFEFKTLEDKLFEIEILFPFERVIISDNIIFDFENNNTIIKYPAKFVKNGCSYRTFEVREE